MPRLLGVEIPGDKRIEASLPYIYGIGPSTAKRILEQANINPDVRAKDLSNEQLNQIIQAITCYRGIRHRRSLPVRGQRTSTNARTRKGPRKTVGVQRAKDAKA